jgi:hypothetical protein
MKKEKNIPVSKGKKNGPGSNPENKFKKGTTDAFVGNVITGTVGNVKAKSGRGLTNEGTNVDYNEER